MGARLLGVIQVDVTEQAGAIERRPALVLRQRLRSEKADEQGERGDVGVGRGEQHGELGAERGPLVLLFGAPCHQYGHARRRVKRSHGHGLRTSHHRPRGTPSEARCWRANSNVFCTSEFIGAREVRSRPAAAGPLTGAPRPSWCASSGTWPPRTSRCRARLVRVRVRVGVRVRVRVRARVEVRVRSLSSSPSLPTSTRLQMVCSVAVGSPERLSTGATLPPPTLPPSGPI
eukprot:scaffold55013_cov52-Phaeocystis_antarctica.AAC.2